MKEMGENRKKRISHRRYQQLGNPIFSNNRISIISLRLRIFVPKRRSLPRVEEGIPSFHLGTRNILPRLMNEGYQRLKRSQIIPTSHG